MRGIMSAIIPMDEPGYIDPDHLDKVFEEANAATLVAEPKVVEKPPKVLHKRGDTVLCLIQGEHGMEELSVTIVEFIKSVKAEVNFDLFLVRSKCRMSVMVHKDEWMAMADNTRNVAGDDVDTAGSYLAGKESMYMELAHCTYGGKTGRSIETAANKIWRNVSPTRIKASRLMV